MENSTVKQVSADSSSLQESKDEDLALMPPPQAGNARARKGRDIAISGAITAAVGAVPLGCATLAYLVVASSNDPYAGLYLIPILLATFIGLPIFVAGLTMLFFGKLRERRSGLSSGVSSAADADVSVEEMQESLVVPVLGVVLSVLPIVSLPFSLYGYFGNKKDSKARRLGLIGIVLNIILTLVFATL